MQKQQLEVADIIHKYGSDYINRYGNVMSSNHKQVLKSIAICRTSVMGGHVDEYNCGHSRNSYNSCRNRHCPKCHATKQAEWLEKQDENILNIGYFHVVFTIPKKMAEISLQNKKPMYKILFDAASQTLLKIAADKKHLGANIGFLGVLHTWGQKLNYHPHVHFVIPGGGLSSDETKWVYSRKRFFLSIKVLSCLFKHIFIDLLKRLYKTGKISFYGSLNNLSDEKLFNNLLNSMYKEKWVVYSKPPFGGPKQVMKYLARYTHRVAISNNRLISLKNGKVNFHYKDYADNNRKKIMTIGSCEFIRRFLLHSLPKGFVRIRYYGYQANCCRKSKIEICRKLLSNSILPNQFDKGWQHILVDKVKIGPQNMCPVCGKGQLICMNPLHCKSDPVIELLMSSLFPWNTS